MNLGLLAATVGHRRFTQAKNAFAYKVFYVACPVAPVAPKAPAFFSFDRFNVFSLFRRDHGAKDGSAWHPWIQERLAERGILLSPKDSVTLIAHPRLFGFAFNPISFWVVKNAAGALKAILCEVRNTFGDNHNYLLASDRETIGPDDILTAEKALYVSPFNPMRGNYEFSFRVSDDSFKAVINYFENGTHVLNTYMGGTIKPLTNWSILKSIFLYPFMTLGVIFYIHWQALVLTMKGVRPTLDEKPRGFGSNRTTHGAPKNTASIRENPKDVQK